MYPCAHILPECIEFLLSDWLFSSGAAEQVCPRVQEQNTKTLLHILHLHPVPQEQVCESTLTVHL